MIATSEPVRGRLAAIDVMRGLIMVLMTLDHVRRSFTSQAEQFFGSGLSVLPVRPEDLDATTPVFFLMRWVTHLCAPAFIYLAGVSVFLWLRRHGTGQSVTRYLLVRGGGILILNVLMNSPGLFAQKPYHVLDVLWAIGMGMILLALVLRLPRGLLWCLALTVLFGHNALDGVAAPDTPAGTLLKFFLTAGSVPFSLGPLSFAVHAPYPALPWFAIMLLGYLSGGLFGMERARRLPILLAVGGACAAGFVALRLAGAYGDPGVWQHFDLAWKTAASFVRVTKYPPSLQYSLLMLGIMFVVLAVIERRDLRSRLLLTLGAAPMVYYVAHLLLIRVLGQGLLAALRGPAAAAGPYLLSAGGVLLFTALVSASLYPLCLWRARQREFRKNAAG